MSASPVSLAIQEPSLIYSAMGSFLAYSQNCVDHGQGAAVAPTGDKRLG
jgi:amino acid permease